MMFVTKSIAALLLALAVALAGSPPVAEAAPEFTCTKGNNWCIPMLSDPPGYFLNGNNAYYISPAYGSLIEVRDIAIVSTWGGYSSPTAMFKDLGLAGVEDLIIAYQDEHQMQPVH